MSRSGCWTGIKRSPKLHFVMNIKYVLLRIREEFGYQIRWIFETKKTNGLWPFPPHFRKVILQFFLIDMVAYVQGAVMARYYEMHAHDFQRYGPFWGVGSTAVWNLCENSSDLVAWPVPKDAIIPWNTLKRPPNNSNIQSDKADCVDGYVGQDI